MAWTIEWKPGALKDFKKIDKSIQKKIMNFLHNKISKLDNPRIFGKALSYEKHGLWRYRVGDFRMICRIDDEAILILVVQVGHRKNIYD